MTNRSTRSAGVLLHLGSLPGVHEAGALGTEGRRFVDFLADCGYGVWEMLPINPVDANGSPYQSVSSFAGDFRLLSLDAPSIGLATEGVAERRHSIPVHELLLELRTAFAAQADTARRQALDAFRGRNGAWLPDYGRYRALQLLHSFKPWWEWPADVRDREPAAMQAADRELSDLIDAHTLEQFLFFEQWEALRRYALQRGIRLIGDLPMFVSADSCEVWANRTLFRLDDDCRPLKVAGVPPDYFSATGQLWGNPVYAWAAHIDQRFRWWCERIEHQLSFFDWLRLDHFRGLAAAWEIPRDSATAETGSWVAAPGVELFSQIERQLGRLPFIADDLGTITPDVVELRRRFNIPGMAVLQFAFDSDARNPYLPHNHERDSIVYTGTHDNNTTLGWFEELDAEQRAQVLEYLGHPSEPMPWPLIRAALASVAEICVLPMQDLLALPAAHRLNTPGTTAGNWQWQFQWDWLDAGLHTRLRGLNQRYGRPL
jgi:4-alpha-glucanotransferase